MKLVSLSIKDRFKKEPITFSLVAAEIYMCLALGAVLILGGTNRISSPAFMYINSTVEWLPLDPNIIWGFSFLAAVLAQLISFRISLLALVYMIRLSAIPFALWSILFAQAATTPTASLTGVVMYSMGFILMWIISLIIGQTSKERQNEQIVSLVKEAERRVWDERTSITESTNKST